MHAGCLSLTRSADGVIERHRIRSIAYKGKVSQGEPAQWVTIEPVAEAIRVLERLSARAAAARGSDTLWPVLVLKTGTKAHISAEIVRQLNVYRDHLDARFGTAGHPAIPPTQLARRGALRHDNSAAPSPGISPIVPSERSPV